MILFNNFVHIPFLTNWTWPFILSLVGLTIVYWWYRERKTMMSILQDHGIPSLKPNILFGNLRSSAYKRLPNVPFDEFLLKRFGPICGYYLGAKPMIVVADPNLLDIIQKIEKKSCLDRPRKVPGGINPDKKRRFMLGNLPVEQWKQMRKILAPAFTTHNLGAMLSNIDSKVQIFMTILQSKKTEEIDFYSHFQLLTLDIIGKTAFGVDSNMQTKTNDVLLLAVQAEFSKRISSFLVEGYLCLPGLVPFITPLREYMQVVKHKMGLSTISALWEAGRSALESRRNSILTEREQTYKDLLHHLADPEKQLSDDQIIANTVLIFEAAYETTSSCLAFMIHLLVHHPKHQRKIRKEMRKVLKYDSLNTYTGLQKLKYLEACIFEALRMYPPQTTFIGRSSAVDLHIQNKDGRNYIIPKGVHVQAAIVQIHRNKDFWFRPNTFLPKRFLGNGKDQLKQSVYQAFGHGPRECIGKGFALMTLKFIMATVLTNYKLAPSENTETSGNISIAYKTATMTPSQGSHARLVEITQV